jgi:hypothetical protein
MRKEDGSGYYSVCAKHGAKGARHGKDNRKKPGTVAERHRVREEQKRLERKARDQANRAKRWGAMDADPLSQPQSPLEERFAAGPKKPLKPLY